MHIDKFLMINCDDNLYLQKKRGEGGYREGFSLQYIASGLFPDIKLEIQASSINVFTV